MSLVDGEAAQLLERPVSQKPEDLLLVQMQGVIAEYERAKILERTRRGRLLFSCMGLALGALVVTMVIPLNAAGSATQGSPPSRTEEQASSQSMGSNCMQSVESEVNTSSEPDPSMLACNCALGETCNGTKLYSQPCGTRVCGKDKYWYTCSNWNWVKEATACSC